MGAKIGIFGGAFDPPHIGHVNLALFAAKELGLDKVIVIPTGESPHKSASSAPYADRLEMARLAFARYNYNFEISDIENKPGKSYTVDTLREIKPLYLNDSLFLIIGGDMLIYFKKWYRYKEILGLCTVAAAAREENFDELREYADGIGAVLLKIPVIRASSTEIRNGGVSLMPAEVYNYVKERGLYNRTD